jgi:clan AA aspartic protease
MGLTYIEAEISNPVTPDRSERGQFLVDSGALYSVVPAAVLERLGIPRARRQRFTLADGQHVEYDVGNARFRIDGDEAFSPVVFGSADDVFLLGVVTLENFGMMLDPFRRELRPMRLVLV